MRILEHSYVIHASDLSRKHGLQGGRSTEDRDEIEGSGVKVCWVIIVERWCQSVLRS